MKTAIAVVDGRLTDEALGKIQRKVDDLKRRVSEGTLDFNWSLDQLQAILEGRGMDSLESLRFLESLTIPIPALPRPTLGELQSRYGWIRNIERDDSSEGPVTLRLVTVLKPKETSINGPTYGERLEPLKGKGQLFGFQHQQWLLEHQNKFLDLMALLGKVYIDFPGIVVVRGGRGRYLPFLSQHDPNRDGSWLRWGSSWRRLGEGFDDRGRVAFTSKAA